MAAVLAAGEGSVLSHRSAAEHWKMLDPATGPVHVTVRRPAGRERRRGLTVHRSGTLLTSHATVEGGIPVTTPARTLSDLRRVVRPPVYRHAVRRAEYRRLPLEDTATDRTRSELERIFLRLCMRHSLPAPETNVAVGPYTVDFAWPRERLIVEVDGWEGHGFRSAFEDDRRRDADLAVMGWQVVRWQVVRFTYARITEAPGAVAATIRYLLAQRERRVAGL